MTPTEISNIIIALVAGGGFFLSLRSTSHTEFMKLFEALKKEFADYKEESKKEFAEHKAASERHISALEASNEAKDKEIEILQTSNRTLVIQNDNFKRYIVRLIRQLEMGGITPEKMEE